MHCWPARYGNSIRSSAQPLIVHREQTRCFGVAIARFADKLDGSSLDNHPASSTPGIACDFRVNTPSEPPSAEVWLLWCFNSWCLPNKRRLCHPHQQKCHAYDGIAWQRPAIVSRRGALWKPKRRRPSPHNIARWLPTPSPTQIAATSSVPSNARLHQRLELHDHDPQLAKKQHFNNVTRDKTTI